MYIQIKQGFTVVLGAQQTLRIYSTFFDEYITHLLFYHWSTIAISMTHSTSKSLLFTGDVSVSRHIPLVEALHPPLNFLTIQILQRGGSYVFYKLVIQFTCY